jgi:hypothetical protein
MRNMLKRKKREEEEEDSIGLPASSSSSQVTVNSQQNNQQQQLPLLSQYNSIVEGASDNNNHLPDSIWDEWLWGAHDALQECHMDVMMNRMHLLGLLIARYRARRQQRFKDSSLSLQSIFSSSDKQQQPQKLLCLFDGPVRSYSIRQLMDTLLNLQVIFCFIHEPAPPQQTNNEKITDAVERSQGLCTPHCARSSGRPLPPVWDPVLPDCTSLGKKFAL